VTRLKKNSNCWIGYLQIGKKEKWTQKKKLKIRIPRKVFLRKLENGLRKSKS